MASVYTVFFILILTATLASSQFNPLSGCSDFTGKVSKCSAELANSLTSDSTVMNGLQSVAFGSAGSTTLSQAVINALCSNLPAVKRFYSCMYREVATCLSADVMRYFPTEDKLLEGITYFCNNINDVDFPCVLSKSTQLVNCVSAVVTADTNSTDFTNKESVVRFLCSVSTKSSSCYSTAYTSCGKSADIVKNYFDLIKPAVCNRGIAMSSSLMLILVLLLTFYRATQDIL